MISPFKWCTYCQTLYSPNRRIKLRTEGGVFSIEHFCFYDCLNLTVSFSYSSPDTNFPKKSFFSVRVIHVKALPIGIPYQRFETLAQASPRAFPTDLKVYWEATDFFHITYIFFIFFVKKGVTRAGKFHFFKTF